MASSSSAKHFSLFVFFLAILFSASSQVEAREGRLFFSKVTRLIGTTNKVVTEVPTSTPTPTPTPTPTSTPAPAPAPEAYNSVPAPAPTPATEFGTESDSGYGLYRTRETPATGVENEMLTQEFAGEGGYGKSNYNVENGRGNYYGNNGYENERSGREQQGMSDTRFLENGKYYHDVKNENENGNKYYYNGYDDQTAERGQRYVFDSIEEYEKYQESQGTYVP